MLNPASKSTSRGEGGPSGIATGPVPAHRTSARFLQTKLRHEIAHALVENLLDRRFSVDDAAKRHKPAPEAYAEITQALGTSPSDMCMIACHTWDTIGSQSVGWEAGLIKRVDNDVPGYRRTARVRGKGSQRRCQPDHHTPWSCAWVREWIDDSGTNRMPPPQQSKTSCQCCCDRPHSSCRFEPDQQRSKQPCQSAHEDVRAAKPPHR